MKKLLLKPGFEVIFSFSLAMILGLPPVLLAQIKAQQDMEIRIMNGDTIVNGKNIKELSASERADALTDINNLSSVKSRDHRRYNFLMNPQDSSGRKIKRVEVFRNRRQGDDEQPMPDDRVIIKDSLGNVIATSPGRLKERSRRMDFNYRYSDDNAGRMNMRERRAGRPAGRFDRKNSQVFEYVNTNGDGVSTHVSFRVSEASDDDLKRMPYVEGPRFEIKDLNLVPQFSSGKTLLMFSLLSKLPAEVKLSDSEGKVIWTEKALNGTFSKSFALGLNGIYYLQIKQGKNISLKKIMKEE